MTTDNKKGYAVDGTLREWVHTIIIVGWLAWLTTNFIDFKDKTYSDVARIDKDITKVSNVELSIDDIKKSVKSIDDRTRNIEIRLGKEK